MRTFDNAVNEGIRCGLEKAWTNQCYGRDDPEERCPMRLADGCACYYRAYHEAPFWRRWRMDKPTRPPQGAVLEALVQQRVDEILPTLLTRAAQGERQ